MKNNYSRLVIIVLITIIVCLYALTVKGYAAGLPAALQQTVTGVVKDEQGMPLPGVTVTVKGTNRGTATNLDGEYEIEVGPQGKLLFTYVGFKKLETAVDRRRTINVVLEQDITALDEVEINAGYYNTTRRESTGNIARVTADEIELQPVVSPLQALQGRMAGVEIIPGGSHPGMASTIRIRGRNSLREEGNFPLYIIDGVPVNSIPVESLSNLGAVGIDPLNNFDLANIQSIEILKDADATAIYGSRGANGVILITSKKASPGELKFRSTVFTGASHVPRKVDLLDTQQYLEIRNVAFENDGMEPNEQNAYDLILWDQNRYTDWQEEFFGGSSPITDINLSVSGGDSKNSFRLSGSYHNEGTVFLGDHDYNRVTAALYTAHASEDDRLNLALSVNYGIDHNDLVGYMDLSIPAFQLAPNAPHLFNDDGSLHWEEWSDAGLDNPLAGFHNTSATRGQTLNSGFLISYKLAEGLDLKSNLGYTTFDGDELVKRPKRSYNPASSQYINLSNHFQTKRRSWIVEPQLQFYQFFGKSKLDALVGATFQQSKVDVLGQQGEGYVSESLIGNLSAAQNINVHLNQKNEYRYNAIFARIGYNWDRKYYINLTGRRDGSSRFGPGKRIANFGAVGGAWIFTEEAFVAENLPLLSFGKLRGSYGTTGNDQIGDYGYLDSYESTFGPGGIYPNQLANPEYSWEVNKKFEAAIDLGFLKDQFNLSVSWYQNRSSNQLVGYPLPAITGFNTVQANLPATVQNSGWEFEVSADIAKNAAILWQTSLNLTVPENKLIRYPNLEQSSYANTYKVGKPLDILLLYQYSGLNPDTGLYTVTDVNEDGRIDIEDRTVPWHQGREFFGGINNSLSYKSFSLQFLWQFVKQEGLLTMFDAGFLGNQRADVIQALEPNSRFQRISTSFDALSAYSDVLNSTFSVVDASFLRLKNLSFAYSVPGEILQHLGLENGKIFLNGQNLLTLTKYKGLDPEQPYGGISFVGLRTLTAGLQLTF